MVPASFKRVLNDVVGCFATFLQILTSFDLTKAWRAVAGVLGFSVTLMQTSSEESSARRSRTGIGVAIFLAM
ncbi:hypothetical protein DSM106972_018260 [Dulcicalothrix desertica PCC 7102]|uniref:Uncharacterized protein n=1 Tax=Dulcicalothrix desertica PCC 7102 TaxID=232991 RepID=A0A3S1AP30_9CYAN|nr:hypothetical protein [Dulcicalothrix desertica]RUT07566.1 hypothetical protein DSM106972_018260 [Dulcicalothrix desertica PCC 7102]